MFTYDKDRGRYLVVTKDGVPFEDQEEGVRQLREACRRSAESYRAALAAMPHYFKAEKERKTMHDTRSYTHDRYDVLVDNTVHMIKQLSEQKGGEYAGDEDRLANFRRNAEAIGLSMEQVWRVYAGKHWDAITQFVHDLGTGKTRPRMESLAGRADDLIVYLILFKAMLEERSLHVTEGEARGLSGV